MSFAGSPCGFVNLTVTAGFGLSEKSLFAPFGSPNTVTVDELYANCYITKPSGLEQFVEVMKSVQYLWARVATLPAS